MALYAFDGTGDRWSPGTRWKLKDLRELTPEQKQELIATITPEQKTDKDRFLTNVVFFYKEYIKSGLHAEYFPGVGSGALFETEFGVTLDFIFGGAFGVGAQGIVNQAFGKLQKNFEKGDEIIDIVGYSRGAAIACMFANKIFQEYEKKVRSLDEIPKIRFIGLFDTVASFGNPLNNNEIFFKKDIPSNVENTFHAMSLDLNADGFGLDRVDGENVLEVWFRGGHGDIGGNSSLEDGPNRKRTNITLNFMLQKARIAGVELLRDTLILPPDVSKDKPLTYPIDINAPIAVSGKPKGDASRQPRKYDIFHYSFFDKGGREIKPRIVGKGPIPNLPPRDRLVIEETYNEYQISRQQLLQLTPDLIARFSDTKSLYDWLYSDLWVETTSFIEQLEKHIQEKSRSDFYVSEIVGDRLRRLRDLKLIDTKSGYNISDIIKVSDKGKISIDLTQYLDVTEFGKEFLTTNGNGV